MEIKFILIFLSLLIINFQQILSVTPAAVIVRATLHVSNAQDLAKAIESAAQTTGQKPINLAAQFKKTVMEYNEKITPEMWERANNLIVKGRVSPDSSSGITSALTADNIGEVKAAILDIAAKKGATPAYVASKYKDLTLAQNKDITSEGWDQMVSEITSVGRGSPFSEADIVSKSTPISPIDVSLGEITT